MAYAQLGTMFATQFLSSAIAAREQAKQAEYQNKAALEANLRNTVRTQGRLALVGAQVAQAKKAKAQSSFDLSKARLGALSAVDANAAAAGTVGASVDAVHADVERAANEARARQDADWEIQQQNFMQELDDIVQTGRDSLVSGVRTKGYTSQVLSSFLSAGGATVMRYMDAKMTLGLGDKSGTTSVGTG